MASNINYVSINEKFPVAGEDNDTQVFRDNFDTIKGSLQAAKTEITDLQTSTAKLNAENDFDNNVVLKAVFQNTTDKLFDAGILSADFSVDYENGPYQVLRIGPGAGNLSFLNFPENIEGDLLPDRVGRVVLELYSSDGASREVTLVASGGSTVKKGSDFPTTLTVSSTSNPVVIEVWRHSTEIIFANLIADYSATSATTIVPSIDNIGDVVITGTPADGQVIMYNASTGKWINTVNLSTVANINSIGDVTITGTPTDGQILRYNSASSQWVNVTNSITNLAEVSINTPANGQVLKYDSTSSRWVNGVDTANNVASIDEVGDVTVASAVTGDVLEYNSVTSSWRNVKKLIEYMVTTQDNGSGSQPVFYLDGTAIKNNVGDVFAIKFETGKTYRFDVSDSSNVAALAFSTTPDTVMTSSWADDYSVGVVRNGTTGTAGAYVEISITNETPKVLYLYAIESGSGVPDTSKWGGEVPIGIISQGGYSGSDLLSFPDPISIVTTATYFSTSGAETSSLANGAYDGQIKVLAMDGDLGDMVITVANPGWVGAGTITFNTVGQACTLQFINKKWFCVGNNGAVFG